MKFGVIFDLDGCLVDSIPLIYRAFNSIFARYGVQLDEEEIRAINGRRLSDQIPHWNQKFGLSLDLDEFRTEALKYELDHVNEEKLFPGTRQLLDALRGKGVPMIVGSASTHPRVLKYLDRLRIAEYFLEALGAEQVENSRPAPDLVLKGATKLDLPPAHCVVVDDAPLGIVGAHAAGAKAVGIESKYTPVGGFKNADLVVNSVGELTYDKLHNLWC